MTREFDDLPPFVPAFGLGNRHVQTVVGSRLRRRDAALEERSTEREFATTPDTRVVARCTPAAEEPGRRAVVLVHGLAGDVTSVYMVGLASKAVPSGFDAVRLNIRNCGGTEHLTPTLYHAGLVDDLDAVVRELVERDGVEQVCVCGFSLGGNVVLRWAGLCGEAIPREVRAVAGVSPAIDLASCSRRVDTVTSSRLYRDTLLALLRHTATHKRALAIAGEIELHPDLARAFDDVGDIDDLRTIRAFDDALIAPSFGFDGADDYYVKASAAHVLDRIAVPTLIVHSRDDPLVPPELIASDVVTGAPNVTVALTERGGHCAFLGRGDVPGHLDRYWAENVVLDAFESACGDLR